MNNTPRPGALKRLVIMVLCGWMVEPVHGNPLQREPNDRARREADNPMRIIVEAATAKRGARTPEAATPAVAAKRPGPDPSKSFTKPTVVTAPPKPPSSPQDPAPAELSLTASSAVTPAAAPADGAAASTDKQPITSLAPLQTESAAQTSQRDRQTPRLLLIHKVDPVLPERVQSQILKDTEVRVRLGIDPDGLVYRVEVQADAPTGLAAAIQTALRRWRFEPISDPVTVTVMLVFRAEE